jgi:Site-specific recombinase XerD
MDVSLIPVASDVQVVLPENITLGIAANQIADSTAHARYTETKAPNTIRRQQADLKLFFSFLTTEGYKYPIMTFFDLLEQGATYDAWGLWQDVTYGLVEAYIEGMKKVGYSIGSINVRLSTAKAYCKLAHRAGAIDHMNLASILMVKAPTHREGMHIDKKRDVTRVGNKKAAPTLISSAHAVLLKRSKRKKDGAMMCLFLDLGLRCSELANLKISDVDLQAGTINFYREKVDITQTHRLSPDCLLALQAYLPTITGPYLFSGYKGKAMSTNGINKRVGELGRMVGIDGLSPHDCRHYLLTEETKKGTDVKTLQNMGGWSSPAMALKYANAGEIANEGASFFK